MTESNWKKFWEKYDRYFFAPLSLETKEMLEAIGVKDPEKLINQLAKRPEKKYRELKKEFCVLLLKEEEKAEKETNKYGEKSRSASLQSKRLLAGRLLVKMGKADGRRDFAIKIRKTIEGTK